MERRSTHGAPALPPDVKSVKKRLADGTERAYYYHRKTGRRIPGEPGTPQFTAALRQAATPRISAPTLDFDWLVTRYQASPEWAGFAEATRRVRRSLLRRITRRFQGARLDYFDREEIVGTLYEWRDEMQASPINADNHLDCLRALLTWARKRRIVRHNWAREIDRLTSSAQNRASLIWTPELWERLFARAEEDERRLLLFAAFSAARQSDIANLRWAQFDGQWIVYKPQKTARRTGITVQLPVYALPPFAELVAALPRRGEFLLTPRAALRWTTANIRERFAGLKARAFPEGDPGRTFHDIRGTTITRLFNAGCSDAEVAAIDGHVIGRGSSLGRYAERSRQLGVNAYNRWCAAEFSGDGQIVQLRR
jgi:integrase